MKRVPLTLFLSLLCIANSGLSVAPKDMRFEGTQDRETSTDQQDDRRKGEKPQSSFFDRLRGFRFGNLFTGRGKKKPATSQPTSSSDISSTSYSDISIDMPNDSTEAAHDVDLNEITKVADAMKKHFNIDVSTGSLQENAQSALRKIYGTSFAVEKALSSIDATDQEKVAPLKDEFEKARTALVKAINEKTDITELLDAYNEKLLALITKIENIKKQTAINRVLTETETTILEALAENKFAQIEDTDEATQKVYKQWEAAIKQVTEALEKPQSDDTSTTTETTELDNAQATLDQATAELIEAIKASKHSKAAQMNWKTFQKFQKKLANVLKTAEALKKQTEKAVKAGRAFQKGDQQAFDELLKILKGLNGETLSLERKIYYLDTGDWFYGIEAKKNSFKDILAKMKAILKRMKSKKQVTAEATEKRKSEAKRQEEERQATAKREAQNLVTMQLFKDIFKVQDLTADQIKQLAKLQRTTAFMEMAKDSPIIDRAMALMSALNLTPEQRENLMKLQETFINDRLKLTKALIETKDNHWNEELKHRKDLSAQYLPYEKSLKALNTKLCEYFYFNIPDSVVTQALIDKHFLDIKDTSPTTQAAYHQWLKIKDSYSRKDFETALLEYALKLYEARSALIKAINEDNPSPAAQKKWEEAKELAEKLNATFAEALEKINTQVAELKEQIKGKLFADKMDKRMFNSLTQEIDNLQPTRLTLTEKKSHLYKFKQTIAELEGIVKRMKTQEQVAEEKDAQEKQAGEQALAAMKKSLYFTPQVIKSFQEQLKKGDYNTETIKQNFREFVIPKLNDWLQRNQKSQYRVLVGERKWPIDWEEGDQAMFLQVETFVKNWDHYNLTTLIKTLQAIEKATGKYFNINFPSFHR